MYNLSESIILKEKTLFKWDGFVLCQLLWTAIIPHSSDSSIVLLQRKTQTAARGKIGETRPSSYIYETCMQNVCSRSSPPSTGFTGTQRNLKWFDERKKAFQIFWRNLNEKWKVDNLWMNRLKVNHQFHYNQYGMANFLIEMSTLIHKYLHTFIQFEIPCDAMTSWWSWEMKEIWIIFNFFSLQSTLYSTSTVCLAYSWELTIVVVPVIAFDRDDKQPNVKLSTNW